MQGLYKTHLFVEYSKYTLLRSQVNTIHSIWPVDDSIERLDVRVDDHVRQMLSQASNRQRRVIPGELNQTNGDFSTIVSQLNIQCPSGYGTRIHDIIAMRLYHYWLALYSCPMIQYSHNMMTWYVIFQQTAALCKWLKKTYTTKLVCLNPKKI